MNQNFREFILNKIIRYFKKKNKTKEIKMDQFILIYESATVKGFFISLNINQKFFLKVFDFRKVGYFKNIFTLEINLLKKLKNSSSFSIPKVFLYKDPSYNNIGFILMEYIEFSLLYYLNKFFLKDFTFRLYKLHQVSNSYYGYPISNYYGHFKNINKICKDWCQFFVENRLKYQINISIKKKLWSLQLDKNLDSFLKNIGNWIPKDESISLLHGDFWIGNCLISKQGVSYIIDPSCYFGSREMDLSSFLFYGNYKHIGFYFLNSYQEYYPLKKDFEKRFRIYNLYYELVMMNVYGVSYRPFILKTLSLF